MKKNRSWLRHRCTTDLEDRRCKRCLNCLLIIFLNIVSILHCRTGGLISSMLAANAEDLSNVTVDLSKAENVSAKLV